jgi:hypothetical protein
MFEILIDTPVISIGRYFIEGSKKEELNSVFESLISHLVGSAITPFCCGAWRIDKEGDDEEYVFFSGWKEIQDHIEFENSEAAKAITTVRKLVKGVEVKHARVLKWE